MVCNKASQTNRFLSLVVPKAHIADCNEVTAQNSAVIAHILSGKQLNPEIA